MIRWFREHHGLKHGIFFAFLLSVLLVPMPPARAQSTDCTNNLQKSGITVTANSVAIVASDNMVEGGNIYYFWQRFGAGGWTRQLVADANGGTCPGNCTGLCPIQVWGYESNAIAWTGESVVIAAVDMRNGGLYYWFQPAGKTTWFQQTIANGPPNCCQFGSVQNGQTIPTILGYSMPSIAWTGASVVVAACDQLGSLDYWYQNKHTSPWNHETVALGGCYGQPSIAWTGQSVVISSPCAAGHCYYWQAAGSRVWNPQIVSNQYWGSSIAWTGNAVVIAALESDSNYNESIVYYWQAQGTSPWIKQTVFGQDPNDGYQDGFFGPSIAATDQSVVIAAGVNVPVTNRLNYAWEPMTAVNTPGWSLENASLSATGITDYSVETAGPRSIAWTGKSVVMTSTTACGDLDYWWQPEGAPNWNRERVVTNQYWPTGTC